ncbi:hypothetical protein PFISCL1PPCAC_17622, partial [Pristionchus fissidentatus]
MERMFEKAGQTQSLQTAEDDLPKIHKLEKRLEHHRGAVEEARVWLAHALPEKTHEAQNMAEDYCWKADNVRALIGDLGKDVASARELLAAYDNVQVALAALEPVAATTLKQPPVDPTTLHEFAAAVEALTENVARLGTDAAARGQERVQTPHEVNVPEATRRVTRLRAALDAARVTADAAATTAAADAEFAQVNTDRARKMDAAAEADSDPAADKRSLTAAIDELNRAEADFNRLYEIYDRIEPSTSDAEQLKTKLSDDLAAADEQFKTLTIALDDKLAGLDEFEIEAAKLDDKINGAKAAAVISTAPEQLRQLANEIVPSIETDLAALKERAEALAPVAAPVAAVEQQQQAVDALKKITVEKLKKAQDDLSAVDALKNDIAAATEAIDRVQQHLGTPAAVAAPAAEEPKKGKTKKDKKKSKETPTAPIAAAPAKPTVPRAELERDVALLREDTVPALERAANSDIDGGEEARALAALELRRAVEAVIALEAAVAAAKASESAAADIDDAAADYNGLLAVLDQFPDLEKTDTDDATETPIKRAVAEEGLKKIDDLLERLNAIPADSLAPEKAAELEELKKTLEAKKSALVALLAALINQDELLKQWEARKLALFDKQQPLEKEMEEVFTRYTTPQRFDLALSEIPRVVAMGASMDDYQKAVNEQKKWAHDHLPSKEDEADNLLAAAAWERQQIRELNADLVEAVDSAAALKKTFDDVHDGVVKLEADAVALISPQHVDEAALIAAKEHLQTITGQLEKLTADIEARSQDRVFNPSGLAIDAVRDRAENVRKLLEAKAGDLATEKALVEVANRFDKSADALTSMIDIAAKVDEDPTATFEQLREASDALSEGCNDLTYMNNEYDHFRPENAAGEALKARMVDELARATEERSTLERSIDDKIEGLGGFTDIATRTEDTLRKIKESSPSADTPEKMEELMKTLEEARTDVQNLEERAEELAPLQAPRKLSQALVAQAAEITKELVENLEKTKVADAQKKEMRDSIDKARESVQSAVDLLLGDDADKKDKAKKKKGKKDKKETEKKVPTADGLEKKIADLTEQLKPLDAIIASPLDIPTEKRDAEDLKKSAADVVANMQKAIDKENESKALADEWEKKKGDLLNIQMLFEKELEELFNRYSTPQSLAMAETDIASIPMIQNNLTCYKNLLKKAKEWAHSYLPEKEHEADNLFDDLNWKSENVKGLKNDLEGDVNSAYEIIALDDNLEGKIADLEKKPKEADHIGSLKDKTNDLRPEIARLVALLSNRTKSRVSNPDVDTDGLNTRLNSLSTTLDELIKASDDDLKIEQAATSFGVTKDKLRNKIDEIAKVDEDTSATVSSLSDASDKAQDAKKDLGRMNEIYGSLEPTTSKADDLRIQMLDDLEKSDQELTAIGGSINDKIDGLKNFEEKYDAVIGKLGHLKDDMTKTEDLPKLKTLSSGLDSIRNAAELLPSIAEEIYGIEEPNRKAQDVMDDLNRTDTLLAAKIADAMEKKSLVDAIADVVVKARDSTKKIEDDVKSSSPESAAKSKKGKKGKKDSSPAVDAPLADTIAALQRLSEQLDPLESAYADSALALPVDAPTEKKDAEKARQNAQDLAARLADDINNKKAELENENKACAVEDALSKIGDKIDAILAPYSDKPQSLTKAESDLHKIADLIAKDLATVPIDQLTDPSSAAATAAKLKQRVKEAVVPLEKEIDAEKKLANETDSVEKQIADLEKELDSARNKTDDPAAAIAAIAEIADRARKLRPVVDAIENAYDTTRPLVAHAAPKPDLASHIDNLLADADRANSQQNEAAQIAALAPEVEMMHELVSTKANEAVPTGLVDQQASLEDLEGRRKKLEDILAGLPQSGPGVDELRAKSEWDLSRLKDLLKKLGDAVGDKLAALAAWNALRKGAEAQLVDLTKEKPVPKDAAGLEKAVDDLTNDEKTLAALAQQTRDGVNPDDLDEDEKKKRADLLNQIDKALALIAARKAAAEQALKDARDQDKLAADLAKVDSRLAPLVEEAARLLADPDAIPSVYDSIAKDLKAATDEARPIVDSARASKDAKKLANAIKKSDKLSPMLEDRFKNWNEFVVARDAGNSQMDKFEEELQKKERADAALPLDEAVKLMTDLEVTYF